MARTPRPPAPTESRFARRKGPSQQRSRTTVENIMQSALELIARDGFHALTTTRIAEHAGVSVGSLYEYFPNREAVLLSLYESVSSRAATATRELIGSMLGVPLEEAVPHAIRTVLTVQTENQLILLDLLTAMPELKLGNHPLSYDKLAQSAVRTYLEHLGVRLSPREMSRCLFFTNQLMMGCIRQYLRAPPSTMTREEFVGDLSRIVINYLRDMLD